MRAIFVESVRRQSGVFLAKPLVLSLVFLSSFSFANFTISNYDEKIKQLLTTTDHEIFSDTINELSRETYTSQFKEALVDKLDSIIYDLTWTQIEDNTKNLKRIISDILELFSDIGTQTEVHQLSLLESWLNTHMPNDDSLLEKLEEVILKVGKKDSLELPSIDKVTQDRYQLPALVPADYLGLALIQAKNLLTSMQTSVIEQDEVLKTLQTLFVKDTLLERTAPEVLYLMGLPGTGKDTIAEAYVDALWQNHGAHKDHLFRMSIHSKEKEWSYLGSPKGYLGSENLPDFLIFLVRHSGGKYALDYVKNDNGEKKLFIKKHPRWNGKYTKLKSFEKPDKAIIFINEAHNISKEVKDSFLKPAIERGRFPINNPGPTDNSVNHIELPITIIIASNEGSGLLEPREKNGLRIGNPLPYKKLLENYHRIKDDKETLKQAILNHNGEKNDPVAHGAPGTSEEFLSRIPSNRIHILKPISPEGLKKIARILETNLKTQLRDATNMGRFNIQLSEELVEFLVSYKAIPSDGARTLKDRLESFVFEPLYESILNGHIKPNSQDTIINIGLKKYQNNAKSLFFEIFLKENIKGVKKAKPFYTFTRLIAKTLNDRPLNPLSDQEIEDILTLREQIVSQVFGVEHIVDRLIEALITSESESRNTDSKRPATVMAFLGKTSTGKTETAKQFVKARYGEDQLPTIIDFNGIRDLQAMKAKILGTVDFRNNPIASDFMKAYDRVNGEIAFIFDEAANAPKELLKGLYEILREPIVTGFSDGKPRPMRQVTIILTGNAGEQIYKKIPTNMSTRRYAQAAEETFKIFIKNESLQSKILTQTFPEALLARIGRNVFHFGPLSNKSKRQIAQLKFLQGLKRLLPKSSERGWHIQFGSEEDLLNIFRIIEIEGYNHVYQGASIDKFVREAIIDAIKAKLLTSGFKNGSTVILSVGKPFKPKDPNTPPYVTLTLTSERGKEVKVNVELQRYIKELPQSIDSRLLVVFHEVGHEIVNHYYFHDVIEPDFLKIIPGVSIIDGELVSYEGLRGGTRNQKIELTKETILRHTAVLAGGYIAEQIMTVGDRHGAGKSDDIKRATSLIQKAVLRWGLSDEWTRLAAPSNIPISDYIDKHLSEREKERLHSITQEWIKQAESMAHRAIISNLSDTFYELSKELAREGELNKEQINKIYDSNFVYNASQSSSPTFNPTQTFSELKTLLNENKENLLKKYSLNDLIDDPNFYENAFSDLSSSSTDTIAGPWNNLSLHVQMMVKVIISGFFEDQNLQARLFDKTLQFDEIIDPDEALKDKEVNEKTGIIEMDKFKIYSNDDVSTTTHQALSCRSLLTPEI